MAVELLPERGAVSFENWILDATIESVTSLSSTSNQQANYPARRLLSPHRSDTWRSLNATVANQRVVFDLGSARLPTCFALADANFDATGYVILTGADNSTISTNAVRWDFPLYAQDSIGKVMRFYPGTPTGGTAGARRFWSVTLDPVGFGPLNPPEDLLEIGVVWLGEYTAIRPWAGFRMRSRDPSTRSRAYSGAQWSDPIRSWREVDVPIGGLTMPDAFALDALIRAQGPKHALLDLYASSTDPIMKRGGCLYGYFAEQPAIVEGDTPDNNSIRLSFEEANG